MAEVERQIGKAKVFDNSKPRRPGKRGKPGHEFHWDLADSPYRPNEAALDELRRKWEDYYRRNKKDIKTPVNESFGPNIIWFPVLESDKEEWERYLAELLSDESKLSDVSRRRGGPPPNGEAP